MSWAHKGGKAVCVGWTSSDASMASMFNIAHLELDRVYTIREVVNRPGGMALLLDEISNDVGGWFDFEMAYAIERFRPLTTQTIEADTAMFKRIADTIPSLEDAV